MLERSWTLHSPTKDGDEGSSAAPKSTVEKPLSIPALPDDLRPIALHLTSVIRRLQAEVRSIRKESERSRKDPDGIALDIEEAAETAGVDESAVDLAKHSMSNADEVKGQIDIMSDRIKQVNGLLKQIKKGEYADCLLFLQDELNNKKQFLGFLGSSTEAQMLLNLQPPDKERLNSEITEIEKYIATLKGKI